MIVGISGLAGSGKSTVADMLRDRHGFRVVSLADPVKEAAQAIFDFSHEQLWGPSQERDKPDPRYTRADGLPLTPRYALQLLGTEFGRHCCPTIWVDSAMRAARGFLALGECRGVAIPDVRFKNELEAVRAAGGRLVRIKRRKAGIGAHASERDLLAVPDAEFDAVIDNDDTLEELRARVDELAGRL